MVPSKFASVRYKSRPILGRTSFRDDTSLVALRYDKTVPAEPPIPLPPHNPLRTRASVTGFRPKTISAPPSVSSVSSNTGASLNSSNGPVVVAPPLGHRHLPVIAPPTEQHPALRVPEPATDLAPKAWKRDSGHEPTVLSVAICEDDCACSEDETVAPTAARPKRLARAPVQQVEGRAPWVKSAHGSVSSDAAPGAGAGATPVAAAATAVGGAAGTILAASPQTATPESSPTLSTSGSRQEAEAFPLRSLISKPGAQPCRPGSSKLSEPSDSAACSVAPMRTRPWERGPGPLGPASQWPSGGWQAASPASPASSTSPLAGVDSQTSTATTITTTTTTAATTAAATATATTPTSAPSPIDDDASFSPLAISIPTDSFLDDDFMARLCFSNRGSVMLGGRRAITSDPPATCDSSPDDDTDREHPPQGQTSAMNLGALAASGPVGSPQPATRTRAAPPAIRVLSADVEKESQKVRSLYETGDAIRWEDGARHSLCERLKPDSVAPDPDGAAIDDSTAASPARFSAIPGSVGYCSPALDSSRRETELAGGLEDWEDIDGADVDRYGFISPPRAPARLNSPTGLSSVSPRKRFVLRKRNPSALAAAQPVGGRMPSRKVSARSLNTQNSEFSAASVRSSRSVIRTAGNLLFHSRNRRWMDEAGDMLTMSPNLQDIVEESEAEKISDSLKRKEWERSEKWRKMATVVKNSEQGEGMEFEFDVKNPTLIERTWKGIPDRWRAMAWWSFLASAAAEAEADEAATATEIVAAFHALQEQSSPDDVQIDLDVPRTISRHIMFRRRYRGGQRLLFRVLHALSIYFPQTGYVQGMASLAATLLCYFDEEKCFVMLVRLWQLRGLERLYRPGFEGLMLALREFEADWLDKDVAKKLTDLGIDATAYGTRWYLTLFNLSMPFAAQLRVWDVFLLLGDGPAPGSGGQPRPASTSTGGPPPPPSRLGVLHATSAALIQALREVLLDSDFENAMKALTSWIPIKDEDLLMKVTKAEWKTHRARKKT